MQGQHLKVFLAQAETTIYFTKTHIAGLQQVIKTDHVEGASGRDDSEVVPSRNPRPAN